jgi:beta-N-acetylhexosaminidase
MLLMGWDGTQVTPQIRSLIEDHHLGSIILTAKNLKCVIPSSIPNTPSLV